MSRFRDALERDVHRVFFNEEEFAERHILGDDGLVPCILDTEVIAAGTYGSREGVLSNTLTVYVPTEYLSVIPVTGQPFSVDGSLHIVRSVSVEMGVLVIVCEEIRE